MLSQTEENYLKCIYSIGLKEGNEINTNAISAEMKTRAASVTDMLKRLADKLLLDYTPYHGVRLTAEGERLAKNLIRNHRLWEVFLVDKLSFSWDEVHDIAEQLEHINSEHLIQRLDKFLGFPRTDPHGDPIPDEEGNYFTSNTIPLAELALKTQAVIAGVKDHSTAFLKFLDSNKLTLGVKIEISRLVEYDHSLVLKIAGKKNITISDRVAKNLLVSVV